jgi:hypothetical protein
MIVFFQCKSGTQAHSGEGRDLRRSFVSYPPVALTQGFKALVDPMLT